MEDGEGVLTGVSLVCYCSNCNKPQKRFEMTSNQKRGLIEASIAHFYILYMYKYMANIWSVRLCVKPQNITVVITV